MKTRRLLLALVVSAAATVASALEVPKIVPVDWLESNGSDASLRIIDIRKPEEYKAGHVPNAINVFYGSWAVTRGGLDNQLPEDEDLTDLMKSAGIDASTPVVIVNKVDTVADQVNNGRVAWTLRYAGVSQIGILDGGFNKWTADQKPTNTDTPKVEAAKTATIPQKDFVATKDEVSQKLGKVTIVDARLPDFFFGVSKLPFVARAGRIPHSVNLPAAWMFTKEGAFKAREDLESMAAGVVGSDKAKEILIYCDTGRLASGGWYVLSEVLGYQNVRLYDGSTQEWAADAKTPMVKYTWQ